MIVGEQAHAEGQAAGSDASLCGLTGQAVLEPATCALKPETVILHHNVILRSDPAVGDLLLSAVCSLLDNSC